MKVRVLYFAGAREIASKREEYISLKDGATVGELADEIRAGNPGLAKIMGSLRLSVNLELADSGEELRDGDEVGVLPPVAGG
jgi:molybdopterin converting factor subunit 1